MPQNNYNQEREKFKQFRDKLYQSFNYRRDTLMDLVDAIAANTTARSPVELSLSALFRREYSALYKGIQEFSRTNQTDSAEVDKRRKSTMETRTSAKALTNSDSSTKAILLVGTGCDTFGKTLCQNFKRENDNLSAQHNERK